MVLAAIEYFSFSKILISLPNVSVASFAGFVGKTISKSELPVFTFFSAISFWLLGTSSSFKAVATSGEIKPELSIT